MTFDFWSWVGLVSNLVTMSVALAFSILAIGLGQRHRSNLAFALFLVPVFGWIGAGQFTQILLWLGQGNPTSSMEASGTLFCLQGIVLFYFAGQLTGLKHAWFKASTVLGFVIWLIGLIPLASHQIVANPSLSPTGLLRWDTYPLGYLFIIVSCAYLLAAPVLLVVYRRRLPHPALLLGIGTVVAGEVIGLSGALNKSPIPFLTLGVTAGITILGSSMAYFQLFKPLNDMTRELQVRQAELEERNRRLEEANVKLHESDKWKEKMTSMIIHDLKNPLTIISVVLDDFKESFSHHIEDAQKQLLDSALVSSQRAQGLVSTVLDVRRLEDGQMPIRPSTFDPARLMAECIQALDPLLKLHQITIETDLPEPAPSVHADPLITGRVIENLFDNAIKFSPSPGTITIRVRSNRDGVQFSIVDSGPGIAPVHQQRIFEKFVQISPPAKDVRLGVGLGLTFCKLAVEAQGGHIWVESDGSDGATFHFTLPAWNEPTGSEISPPSEQ
jgi:signal transduction histidine kinase